ncbi:hypothetical protein AAMO2058_000343200 [Amorphochlora amoebiformis]|eukprot:1352709-Amorphochlora_amoeboformis.AAC.1
MQNANYSSMEFCVVCTKVLEGPPELTRASRVCVCSGSDRYRHPRGLCKLLNLLDGDASSRMRGNGRGLLLSQKYDILGLILCVEKIGEVNKTVYYSTGTFNLVDN